MKRGLNLILLTLLISAGAYSQQNSLGLQCGIGTYSMEGLKKLNSTVVKSLPFDAEIVADFPPFYYFRPFVMTKINALSLGISFTYQSTGSRVSSKDYSAEYCVDMITNSFGPAVFGEIVMNPHSKLKLAAYGSTGIMFSELKLNESLIVLDNSLIDDNNRFKAYYWSAEPGLNMTYPFEFMVFGVNAGYMVTLTSKYYSLEGNEDMFLLDPESGDPVKPEWDGFRFGISVGFSFN